MAATDLGKVMVTPRGAFTEGVAYKVLDIVSYGGGSYVARRDTAGELPSDSGTWMQIAAKGEPGTKGDNGMTALTSGFFTLSGDPDGNLWAYYVDGDTPPAFEVDSGGNIYYIVPE